MKRQCAEKLISPKQQRCSSSSYFLRIPVKASTHGICIERKIMKKEKKREREKGRRKVETRLSLREPLVATNSQTRSNYFLSVPGEEIPARWSTDGGVKNDGKERIDSIRKSSRSDNESSYSFTGAYAYRSLLTRMKFPFFSRRAVVRIELDFSSLSLSLFLSLRVSSVHFLCLPLYLRFYIFLFVSFLIFHCCVHFFLRLAPVPSTLFPILFPSLV